MTALHELETRLGKLKDVREILTSMKNLAFLETRKLGHRLETQHAAVALIERAAGDLLDHYPELHPGEVLPPEALVLVGAERGFCGNFNARLIEAAGTAPGRLVAVGRKLYGRLEEEARLAASVDGPSVCEEIDPVLERLVAAVGGLGKARIDALFHDSEGTVRQMPLLPPFTNLRRRHAADLPPVLNLEPATLFLQLVDQYLFAALQLALVSSLLAENTSRVQHLEGAVQHLDERLAGLENRRHQLRQEEIIEEIEIILLNTTDPDRHSHADGGFAKVVSPRSYPSADAPGIDYGDISGVR